MRRVRSPLPVPGFVLAAAGALTVLWLVGGAWPLRGDAPGADIVITPATPAAAPATATVAAIAGEGVAARHWLHPPSLRDAILAIFASTDVAPETVRYRAALEARDAGDLSRAIALFQRTIDAGGVLQSMAELRMAQALVSAGHLEEAARVFDAVLDDPALPPLLRDVALAEAAANLATLEHHEEALALLAGLAERPDATAGQQAAALWDTARVRRALEDPAWIDAAIEAMSLAPGSESALAALNALAEAGVEPPEMVAAQVHYRWRQDEEATRLYERALDGGALTPSETGAAWFYLGALAEREFDRDGALEAYARSLEAAPDGSLADDARYWRGRVYEELGDPASAAVEYDLVGQQYPASPFAADAQLRGALALGLAGDTGTAAVRLEQIVASAAPAGAAEAARWHQVLRDQFGAATDSALDPAASHPTVLWSLMATETLSQVTPAVYEEAPPPFALLDAGEVAEVEAWIEERHGPRDATASEILAEPRVALGFALIEGGDATVGRSLLFEVASDYRGRPYQLLDLGVEAQARGLHDVAMNAANGLLSSLTVQEQLGAPRPLLRLAYPAPHTADLVAAADEWPVPPLLLLALVRQESAFNPQAVSPAGAVGLGQVMPATGEAIATALDRTWDPAALHDPATSLRYTAYYLSSQLEAFDGNVLAALSAYNGGPGNAERWLEAQPFDGPDGFLYGIDFTETRAYLQHVLENYAWYRYVYTGVPAPALP